VLDEETKKKLDAIGYKVARVFKGYGSVRFNIKNGEFINYNVEISVIPNDESKNDT